MCTMNVHGVYFAQTVRHEGERVLFSGYSYPGSLLLFHRTITIIQQSTLLIYLFISEFLFFLIRPCTFSKVICGFFINGHEGDRMLFSGYHIRDTYYFTVLLPSFNNQPYFLFPSLYAFIVSFLRDLLNIVVTLLLS